MSSLSVKPSDNDARPAGEGITSDLRITARNIFPLVVSKGVSNGIVLLSLAIIARFTQPSDAGLTASGAVLALLLFQICETGVDSGLLHHDLSREAIGVHFTVRLVAAGFILVLAVLLPWLHLISSALGPPLVVLSLGYSAQLLYTTPKLVLENRLELRTLLIFEFIGTAVGCTFAAATAMMGGGWWAYAALSSVPVLVQTMLALFSTYKILSVSLSSSVFRSMVGAIGLPIWAAQLIAWLLKLDIPLITRFSSRSEAGQYAFATSLVLVFATTLSGALIRLVTPIFIRNRRNRHQLQLFYGRILSGKLLIAVPVFGLIVCGSPLIWQIVLPRAWHPALVPFQILTVAMAVKLFYDDQAFIMAVINLSPKGYAIIHATYGLIFVPSAIVLGMALDPIIGVSLALLFCTAAVAFAITKYNLRELPAIETVPFIAAAPTAALATLSIAATIGNSSRPILWLLFGFSVFSSLMLMRKGMLAYIPVITGLMRE